MRCYRFQQLRLLPKNELQTYSLARDSVSLKWGRERFSKIERESDGQENKKDRKSPKRCDQTETDSYQEHDQE
jgi:hypothetical protein